LARDARAETANRGHSEERRDEAIQAIVIPEAAARGYPKIHGADRT
jgi:hypothetical protein